MEMNETYETDMENNDLTETEETCESTKLSGGALALGGLALVGAGALAKTAYKKIVKPLAHKIKSKFHKEEEPPQATEESQEVEG